MAKNENHIDGIFNYCDRWCERCHVTNKCEVFERTHTDLQEDLDEANTIFWNKLTNTFKDTVLQLQKIAADLNINIDAEDDKALNLYIANAKQHHQELGQHPLIKYCKQYIKVASKVLEVNGAIKQHNDAYLQMMELGIKNHEETIIEVKELHNYYEIVQWYLYQIQVKFMRALPAFDDDFEDETNINDSNGSAKVALIATDRSLQAWQQIMHLIPDTEDDIIPLLALLQKIRTLGEKSFPNARAFVRVGLDS
jgi:hypothetical protein